MHRIIGIVGMCGAGKSKATDFFIKNGWNHIYFGGVTLEEVKRRGLEVNEVNERKVREQLRNEYGPAAYAILLKERIRKSAEMSDTVLDGLYSWHEYLALKNEFGRDLMILAIVTDRRNRYERLRIRNVRSLTAEDAEKRDIAEIENLAKGGPIAIADYYILNNGDAKQFEDELCIFYDEIIGESKQ